MHSVPDIACCKYRTARSKGLARYRAGIPRYMRRLSLVLRDFPSPPPPLPLLLKLPCLLCSSPLLSAPPPPPPPLLSAPPPPSAAFLSPPPSSGSSITRVSTGKRAGWYQTLATDLS
eukprot:1564754-Rhodomonas_salina.2